MIDPIALKEVPPAEEKPNGHDKSPQMRLVITLDLTTRKLEVGGHLDNVDTALQMLIVAGNMIMSRRADPSKNTVPV